MKFILESVSKCSGRARLGVITTERLQGKTFPTPFALINNPQLSREVLELSGIDISGQGISLPIFNVEQMERPVSALKKSLSHFVGLPEALTFVTLKNSSEFCPSGSHVTGSVPIFKRGGKINIAPERYMNMIDVFQPDFFTSLCDGDTHQESSNKRTPKAVERSDDFFKECFERRKTSSAKSSFFVASVEGGYNEFERKKAVDYLKEYESEIDGFFIDGLHRNGHEATTLTTSAIKEIVDQTLLLLPSDKMKMMLGAYSPKVLLSLVDLGVDLFDTSFAQIVTNANRALVFNFDLEKSEKLFPEIDLMDSKFKDDFTPFVEGCECYACKKHTRAYTNHLLLTHELLGTMLLSIHNTYHYLKFFDSIRKAIKNDKLLDLANLIGDQYNESESKLIYKIEEKPVDNKENK